MTREARVLYWTSCILNDVGVQYWSFKKFIQHCVIVNEVPFDSRGIDSYLDCRSSLDNTNSYPKKKFSFPLWKMYLRHCNKLTHIPRNVYCFSPVITERIHDIDACNFCTRIKMQWNVRIFFSFYNRTHDGIIPCYIVSFSSRAWIEKQLFSEFQVAECNDLIWIVNEGTYPRIWIINVCTVDGVDVLFCWSFFCIRNRSRFFEVWLPLCDFWFFNIWMPANVLVYLCFMKRKVLILPSKSILELLMALKIWNFFRRT